MSLFKMASKISHSCEPNCRFVFGYTFEDRYIAFFFGVFWYIATFLGGFNNNKFWYIATFSGDITTSFFIYLGV